MSLQTRTEAAEVSFTSTKNTLNVYTEFVGPVLAQKLLDNNIGNNRKVNKRRIASYAEQMQKGLWQPDTGEAIKFSGGKLIDGQHRLLAIIKACEEDTYKQVHNIDDLRFSGIEMLFMTGIPKKAFVALDDGKKRSLSDAFRIQGLEVKNQSFINSALNLMQYTNISSKENKHYSAVSRNITLSKTVSIEAFKNLPQFKSSTERFFKNFNATKIRSVMPTGVALALYYLFNDLDEELTFHIFKTLETGRAFANDYGVEDKSPAMMIHKLLSRQKQLQIRVEAWKSMSLFLWAFTASIERKTDLPPRHIQWKWNNENPIIKHANKKLRHI